VSAQVGKLLGYSDDYLGVLNENDSFCQYQRHHYHHPEKLLEEYTSDKALVALARKMMKADPVTTLRFFIWNFL